MAEDKDLVTAHALAEALALSVETIWRYTREKRIPFVELGGRRYRYRLADVTRALTGLTIRERVTDYQARADRVFTYEDYLKLPEEPGCRFEVLEGVLIRDASPSVRHQRASRRIQRILEDYFWEVDAEGEVFGAPLDVTLSDITVVQPDVFYVSGDQRQIVKEVRIDGSPVLVVEVISPSSQRKDRLQKLRIYRQAGVLHYWILSPEDRTLECFALRDGVYAAVAVGMDEDVVDHPDFPGLSVHLGSLWSGR